MNAVRLLGSVAVAFGLALAAPVHAQDKTKAAQPAMAEKGKAVVKVLHEDDNVRVTESTFKPGDVGPNVVRGLRVTRPLTNGTLERTYADGKKETLERKAGQVIVAGPDKQAFFTKNIGKSNYASYTVTLKSVK